VQNQGLQRSRSFSRLKQAIKAMIQSSIRQV
jgi:hypothetical protein